MLNVHTGTKFSCDLVHLKGATVVPQLLHLLHSAKPQQPRIILRRAEKANIGEPVHQPTVSETRFSSNFLLWAAKPVSRKLIQTKYTFHHHQTLRESESPRCSLT